MSKFIFTCPQCRKELEAEEEWIGLQTECPYCKQSIDIKKTQTAPASVNIAPNEKKCPFCGKSVKKEAVFCKHCKRDLDETSGDIAAQIESEKTFPYICPDCDTFVELPLSMQGQPYECIGCAESHTATPATGRKCPYCGETIKIQASICRFCRKPVPPLSSKTARKGGFIGGTRPAAPQKPRAFSNISQGRDFWGITETEIGFIRMVFYAWLICEGLLTIFHFLSMLFVATSALMIINYACIISAIVGWCMLYYQYWKQVPVSEAETTPGKAVGFLFIPFFQIYWVITTTLKLSRHYEQFDDFFNKIGFPVSKIAIRYFYMLLGAFVIGLFIGIARTEETKIFFDWMIFIISLFSSFFGILWMFAMYRCAHNIPRID